MMQVKRVDSSDENVSKYVSVITTREIITRTPEQAVVAWIEALRSGEYSQAAGGLRCGFLGEFEHCCLGVLCDLAARDGGPAWTNNTFMGSGADLPCVVREFVGMSVGMENTLMEMNDNMDKDFSQIADYIERKLLPKLK